MYLEIFPAMERVHKDLMPDEDIVWPRYINLVENTKIVLKDLKELNYHHGSRENGLDFPQACLAVKALAKFHALSMFMIEQGMISPRDFSQYAFIDENEFMNDLLENGLETLIKVIKRSQAPQWDNVVNELERLPRNISRSVKDLWAQPCKWKVINHGDFCVNNILFKYGNGTTSRNSVKIIDYRLAHYGSLAFDLQYFLQTSVCSQFLTWNENIIFRYTQSLHEFMDRLNLKNKPTYQEVNMEVRRLEFFGLFTSLAITPVLIAPRNLAPPLFDEMLPIEEIMDRNEWRYKTTEYTDRARNFLRRAMHGGLFERLRCQQAADGSGV